MEQTNQADLDKLKLIELDILNETISVCKKLNIRYYVLGGTLLGAVRHKGFIPWDDDIDIGMLRPDYDVFVEKAPQYLGRHLFLQTHKTDPQFFQGFAKIRNSDTTFIETVCKTKKMNHGIYIDVFPLDIVQRKDDLLFNSLKFMLSVRIFAEFLPDQHRSVIGRIGVLCSKLLFPSAERAFQKREALYRLPKRGEYIANHNGAWGKKEIVPARWYGEGTPLEFEGLQVMAPKEYDKWLRQVYGDYWQLPPAEQRVPRHDTVLIDTDNSYRKYCNG